MLSVGLFVLVAHFALLLVLSLFGLHRLSMVFRWFRWRRKFAAPATTQRFTDLPMITVQIPVFNEKFVAERIIDAAIALSYPADKLQIQIVDDSTDDTAELIRDRVQHYQRLGYNIEHRHRTNRQGFKAGALKEAMAFATGEFIAIFDADFVPDTNILNRLIHAFTDASVGMVQARWTHLNRDSNRLTRTEAIMLDAHFALEQEVRAASGSFLNFNGTAGIWRKSTIIDAGNWEADTLTEDLDLSYRAQLKGWKMAYLNDVECPAEIPADMAAFKSQQHRWAKGGVEVMLKLLKRVWRSPISVSTKIESTFHLSNNLAYLLMLIDATVFLIPSIFIRDQYDLGFIWWLDLPLLLLSSGGHLIYLVFGQFALAQNRKEALLSIPWLLLLGIQLSYNNARAAVEALAGYRTEFVRTPKSGEGQSPAKPHRQMKSYVAVAPRGAVFELALAGIFAVLLAWASASQLWFLMPVCALLMIGYASTSLMTFHAASGARQ
ncbi:Beta-monoglucosyldiacylglycerol synthase [BD1-7 clade bacterium]|uniref:Beta-monoglucosyldiacylglycerol synthase n=1 Tax=BD1-7 clade bacterium TaxID=2029982 RepID=A0A5S9MS23_9GAMM|nr:Beta-monoglucosyldiacylglycerol synthase [BD1-7 clade bacterium]CAA0084402.1 Beta-monoglucosyldiacylglycerol synthase [BD1-7 clade bacterium]